MIKFDVHNRFTNAVQFTAEIDCADDAPRAVKVGSAVRWALQTGVSLVGTNLRGADLRGADLSGATFRAANLRGATFRAANLRGADLRGADLSGADLRRADLSGADLRRADLSRADLAGADLSGAERSFKADLWLRLTQNRAEVPALIAALRDGRIDGSVYEGECACLVGTLARARGVHYTTLDPSCSHPAEQWFGMIAPGDKPGDDTAGGYAAQKALEWCLEWCALSGIDPNGEKHATR